MGKKKIIRAVTVSQSLIFVEGVLPQLKEKYDVRLLCAPEIPLNELVDKYQTTIYPVMMERHISLFKDLKALIKIIGIFRREKPYMVHSMTPKAGLLCMIAAWLTRVPVRIHTFTGLVWPTATGLSRKVLKLTDKITCACATHIIPEGEGVKNDLIQGGITSKELKVLGYGNVRGVDMVRFCRRTEVIEKSMALKDDSKFSFIFVGRIVGDKGINELVHAFVRLQKTFSNIRLILVGNFEDQLDPVSEETRKIIDTSETIDAVGVKYGDDLLAYYAASDCFVFPSYREGFPNTVMEAGAMGLPSIVTDINGSREIIINGENGFVIPPRNEDALYEAMVKIIDTPDLRKKMADSARGLIESRFEQGFVQKCLLDYYDEILK